MIIDDNKVDREGEMRRRRRYRRERKGWIEERAKALNEG